MTDNEKGDFDFLERAGFVLMALQIAIFGYMWVAEGRPEF